MATTKQVKMLLARSAEAGIKASWEDFAELNNGEIDQKLAEFAKVKDNNSAYRAHEAQKEKDSFNQAMFGLCCKIVMQKFSLDWCIAERGKFGSEVLSLYKSCRAAERLAKASPSNNWDDVDYKAEMAAERAEEGSQ